ncbi:MAG: DUF2891 family protein [Bradyrhizobium sp.]|nr:DUF2891 family protein [Bradyrhizobium sp.]
MSPELARFQDGKDAIAAELAHQVACASRRQDTRHPAFKGCVDWHSAVHGVWALIAYQRATGDARYASLVASILNADALCAERQHLSSSPQFEMPYGRAWFLRLAIDHHRLTGADDLLAFTDEVAASLHEHFRVQGIDPLSGAYASCSFALINMLDYARYRNASELEDELVGWIKKDFVDAEQPYGYACERCSFMAVGTNAAALTARVLDRATYASWLDGFIAANGLPSPVLRAASDHEFGLNFSRAWGLWDMYAASGRADVARCYAEHLHRGLTPATNWRGDYLVVGHWVAQFAMFALQPLFGAERGR